MAQNALLPAIPKVGSKISAKMVADIETQIVKLLPKIGSIEEAEEFRAQAAALESYLRDKGLQKPMLGTQRRIEARIGQILGPALGHGPGRGKKAQHDEGLIEHDQDRSDFRILAHALDGKCKPELTDDEWRKSRRAFVSLVRNRVPGLRIKTPELPDGVFRCIVADPPWQLDTGPEVFGGTGESGHDSLDYEQMSIDDIKELKVSERAADDSHLYLWTTNKYIEHAYDVARVWGFKPSVLLVWAKAIRGVGLGDAYRLTTEFILYARRGSLNEMKICERTWFDWPRGKHSEKPAAFYKLVESMTPANGEEDRLEMFARKKRKGWTVWGDEV